MGVNLKKVFTDLGATQFRIYDNLYLEEMDRKLDEAANYLNSNHSAFTWMAVFVLSHGKRDHRGRDLVFSSNGLPMDRKEIIDKFVERQNIPNFKGKPRF